jgi:hypothetical protein
MRRSRVGAKKSAKGPAEIHEGNADDRFARGAGHSVGVQVVGVPRLIGAAMAGAVVRDHPINALAEEEHLGVQVVR